mmetsp:Transcript_8804/g.15991  ORF Transcript_8804/g.15991 Transcript_8804/m.15991 type:complete len:120 (+) Transcript_8804:1691-2050(+)
MEESGTECNVPRQIEQCNKDEKYAHPETNPGQKGIVPDTNPRRKLVEINHEGGDWSSGSENGQWTRRKERVERACHSLQHEVLRDADHSVCLSIRHISQRDCGCDRRTEHEERSRERLP